LDAAIKNYDRWLVPTNMVEARKVQRHYTKADLADLDVKTSVNKIGEIINLSQKLNSILWDKVNNGASFEDVSEIYTDICQLSVMSNIEIDKAKKEFDVNNVTELNKISEKYKYDELGNRTEPRFLGIIAKRKSRHNKYKNCLNGNKEYKYLDTSMDYLEELIIKFRRNSLKKHTIPFSDIINFDNFNKSNVWYPQIHKILGNLRKCRNDIQMVWKDPTIDNNYVRMQIVSDIEKEAFESLNSNKIGLSSMLHLLKSIEDEKYADIRNQAMSILFGQQNAEFYSLLKNSKEKIQTIRQNEYGDIALYGINFKYN
jgi:hypothetical protein